MSTKVLKYLKWLKQTKVNYDFDVTGLQPFIFSHDLGKENNPLSFNPEKNCIIACPFPLFSIEIEGANFLIHDDVTKVDCIICREVSVGVYEYLMLGRAQDSDVRLWLKIQPNHRKNRQISQLVDAAIIRIHTKAIGRKANLDKVSYKNATGKKSLLQPSQIIYISRLRKGASQQLLSKDNKIKWSNKWTVIAHWRKLDNPDSLGINRQGIRSEKGFTFVKNHDKGEGELLIKPRKVCN